MEELRVKGTRTVQEIVNYLVLRGLAREREGMLCLEAEPSRVIIELIRGGIRVDIEYLSEFVSWQEFEELIRDIMREFGFKVFHRLRVPLSSGRVEIDLVAVKEPDILLVEVKHYRRARLRIEQCVEEHLAKVKAITQDSVGRAELLKRIGALCLGQCRVIPVVVTLREYTPSIVQGIPLVPVWKLRDFLLSYRDNLDVLFHVFI